MKPPISGQATASLAGLQRWMQEVLLYPRLANEEQVNNEVLASSRLSAADCLGVYQRSYYARLLTCMREQFPALCYALGSPVFNEFARDYLLELPSDSYTLYQLGRRFPGYLSDTRPDRELPPNEREHWIDFMIDLADFEREVFTMFDAPGDEGKLADDVNLADEELALQRCFKIHQAKFPVARFYSLVRDEKNPELPPLQTSQIAMVRVNYRTRLIPLTNPQYQFLLALGRVGNVPSAFAAMDAVELDVDDIRSAWLTPEGWREQWLASGFFVHAAGLSVA
ncbi:MAG: HvfC/BufC N-terminal domain-containing protein [Burkholderiales bacterium]|nr:DNA-binding domain-containing protein [Sulfuricellaceae bacterium]